jgi:hypothetical protein
VTETEEVAPAAAPIDWIDIVATVVMALAALATAWSVILLE